MHVKNERNYLLLFGFGEYQTVAQYITKNLNNIDFDFFNIVKFQEYPNFDAYDFVGFATFVDAFGPPKLVYDFLQQIPKQNNKLAFVLATYGFAPGRTLKAIANMAEAKGFTIIVGHHLRVPENYPPAIVGNLTDQKAPDVKQLKKLQIFISDFNEILY